MSSVLQVCSFYANDGGVERHVQDLARALQSSYSVSVLCTNRQGKNLSYLENGVQVRSLGGRVKIAGRPLAFDFPFELGSQEKDLVHYHLPFPLAVASHLVSKPKVKATLATWHHDIVRQKAFAGLTRPLVKTFLESMDRIIVTSPNLIKFHPLLKAQAKKCEVVPLGVNESVATPASAEAIESVHAKYGESIILFVGRLVYYKGLDLLIEAMRDLPAHLLIVGSGPLENQLKAQSTAANLQDKITFLSRVSDDDLPLLYQSADLLAFPSTHETECFGLVQAEAMLCGKPVVNTNLQTGVPWVCRHELEGLTVEPSDGAALKSALRRLLASADLRAELGTRGKKRAREMFTLKNQVTQIEAIYSNLLKKN